MLHIGNAEIGKQYRVKALDTDNVHLKHRLRALCRRMSNFCPSKRIIQRTLYIKSERPTYLYS